MSNYRLNEEEMQRLRDYLWKLGTFGTREVAEHMDITRPRALTLCQQMVQDGDIERIYANRQTTYRLRRYVHRVLEDDKPASRGGQGRYMPRCVSSGEYVA